MPTGDGKQDCGDKWQAEPHGAVWHPPGLASDWHPFKYRSFMRRLSSGWEGRTCGFGCSDPFTQQNKSPVVNQQLALTRHQGPSGNANLAPSL